MPANDSPTRNTWGKRVTWNGGGGTYSQWDVLYNKNNYLGYNDVSSCNRQGLDGGVIESWGSSVNNTWEYNAVHDNEVRRRTRTFKALRRRLFFSLSVCLLYDHVLVLVLIVLTR
jgi:hypothetical protein